MGVIAQALVHCICRGYGLRSRSLISLSVMTAIIFAKRLDSTEGASMSNGLIDLISILDLEPIEVNMFRGNSPKTSWQRGFGGQAIGQPMVAECRPAEGPRPH